MKDVCSSTKALIQESQTLQCFALPWILPGLDPRDGGTDQLSDRPKASSKVREEAGMSFMPTLISPDSHSSPDTGNLILISQVVQGSPTLLLGPQMTLPLDLGML